MQIIIPKGDRADVPQPTNRHNRSASPDPVPGYGRGALDLATDQKQRVRSFTPVYLSNVAVSSNTVCCSMSEEKEKSPAPAADAPAADAPVAEPVAVQPVAAKEEAAGEQRLSSLAFDTAVQGQPVASLWAFRAAYACFDMFCLRRWRQGSRCCTRAAQGRGEACRSSRWW